MEELEYTDKVLNYQNSELNLIYLQDFTELVFVNFLTFTPQEKELIAELENSGQKVRLYQQIEPEDYDETDLELKSVTLPERLKTEVEIYQTEQELIQLVTALSKADKAVAKPLILDADFANGNYYNLLARTKVKVAGDISFTKTKLYRFLEALYSILKSADFSNGKLKLWLEELVEASYLAEFRDYYKLEEAEINGLGQLAQNGYVYFCQELISEQLAPFKRILTDIKKLNKLNNLNDFCSYLAQLEMESLNDSSYKNDLAIFFSSLTELAAIKELEIVNSWSGHFSNNATGLFLLVLNYLQFKEVKITAENSQAQLEIKDLLSSSFAKRDHIIMLNLAEGIVPGPKTNNFLLNAKQRESLGESVKNPRYFNTEMNLQ